MTTQPEQLHHLLDRLRRGVLLPAEAEQLARLVGELEARIVTLEHVAAGNKRHVQLIVPDLEKAEARVTELEAENATLRDALAHCRHKPRIAELEAEVARLTAGQCTDSRRMCDLHHTVPVTDCPYPKCLAARETTTA